MRRTKANYRWINSKSCFEYRFTFRGERYSIYGKTIKECESKADEKKQFLKEHLNIDNQRLTLEQYYNNVFLPEQEKIVKASTLYSYEKSWNIIRKKLGKKRVVDLSKGMIISFQKGLLSDTSPNNANRCLKFLRQILNGALKDRVINYNPASSVNYIKVDHSDVADTTHRALTEDETARFLKQAEGSHYYLLFKFLLNTGCRIGEALYLQWSDIDFVKREICIKGTVSRVSNTDFGMMDSPKTRSSVRVIPLTSTIEEILKEQKRRNWLMFQEPFKRNIFPNTRGETPTYNSINQCIKNITEQASREEVLDYFSVHALRDTFATRAIEQGMQPNTLKSILGHSSLKMTMDLYVHVLPNTKMEEMSKLVIAG